MNEVVSMEKEIGDAQLRAQSLAAVDRRRGREEVHYYFLVVVGVFVFLLSCE